MDRSPLALAINAEEAANGLHYFKDEVPRCAIEITAEIGLLFQISSVLRELDTALLGTQFGLASGRITHNLDRLMRSFQATIDAIKDMFGRPRFEPYTGVSRANELWKDLSAKFEQEHQPLQERLKLYLSFVRVLKKILEGRANRTEIDDLKADLLDLLNRQEFLETYDEESPVLEEPVRRPRPRPRRVGSFDRHVYSTPQESRPLSSPTFSNSSSQTFPSFSNSPPQSPGAVTVRRHWATRVFDGRHTQTRLDAPSRRTSCLGENEPAAQAMLIEDGFVKVLEQPFDAQEVTVQLHCRPRDHRARILILSVDWNHRPVSYCIPLSALKILRDESNLQLCRLNRVDGGHDLWANLRFVLYERMVLFYCTLVAMKRQDPIPSALEDFFQPFEEQEFGAEICDGNLLHAFRVFRDRDSGGVRFEATARRGPMKHTPIWTAFVTEYIGAARWMQRVAPNVLSLKELRPYVFCDGYRLPQGPDGRYELRFRLERDCENFMYVFHRIRRR